MTTITGFSHVAVNTADLPRFRRFYEGLLGLSMGVMFRMNHPPYLRHATFHVDGVVVLRVVEVPGYDPAADGGGAEAGRRGRIDRFALRVVDEAALRRVAERLRAAGASDGEVRRRGPTLSVHVTDPDGLAFEVDCPHHAADEAAGLAMDGDEIEEIGAAGWPRVRGAGSAAFAHDV